MITWEHGLINFVRVSSLYWRSSAAQLLSSWALCLYRLSAIASSSSLVFLIGKPNLRRSHGGECMHQQRALAAALLGPYPFTRVTSSRKQRAGTVKWYILATVTVTYVRS